MRTIDIPGRMIVNEVRLKARRGLDYERCIHGGQPH
jgi:hypothetical protein